MRRRKKKKIPLWKRNNLVEFEGQVEQLRGMDYEVLRFIPPAGATDVRHHRVNDIVDFWPTTKSWMNRRTWEKGNYDNLIEFIKNYVGSKRGPRFGKERLLKNSKR